MTGESLTSEFNFSTPIKADRTIYAKWTPENHTVTFNANGGTGSMPSQTFTYGRSQSLTKNTFEKSGYLFGGWATSSTATSTTYGDEAVLSEIESDLTLYAVWTQRGSISGEKELSATLDEENEQIIFTAGSEYVSYMWVIDNNFASPYGTSESITIPYSNTSLANGQKHSVILIGVDSNGDTFTESANFTILPKN